MAETKNCEYTLKSFEKNKYFYGKLMTVRDFKLQNDYHAGQLQLVNRLVHGVGVVCGLEVSLGTIVGEINFKINNTEFSLTPGVALDCCGREIVVKKDVKFEVEGSLIPNSPNYVYLKYAEENFEKVPVGGGSSCGDESCCDNRTRETFSLEINDKGPECSIWEKQPELSIESLKQNGVTCSDNCNDCKVLLAVVNNNGTLTINTTETQKRNLVFSNPTLFRLIKKNNIDITNHISDHNNPHQVTAAQIRALQTINNIGNNTGSNYTSNINLKSPSGDNTIDISPKPSSTPGTNIDTITFKLNDDAVISKHIKEADTTSPTDTNNGTGIATGHIRDKAVTPEKLSFVPIRQIKFTQNQADTNPDDAIVPVGGSDLSGIIKLFAGNNINLSKKDSDGITISSTAANLDPRVDIIAMYMRERALKCMVTTTRAQFASQSLYISLLYIISFLAVSAERYKDSTKFVKLIDIFRKPIGNSTVITELNAVCGEINPIILALPEKQALCSGFVIPYITYLAKLDNFSPFSLYELLGKEYEIRGDNFKNYILPGFKYTVGLIKSNNNPLELAALQDEICFYISLMVFTVQSQIVGAVNNVMSENIITHMATNSSFMTPAEIAKGVDSTAAKIKPVLDAMVADNVLFKINNTYVVNPFKKI